MYFPTRFGNIYYEETGRGQPLLLIHDAIPGESSGAFRTRVDGKPAKNGGHPCAERLSKKFRVYAVDLLGFGKSDKPSMDYSAYLYASVIRGFVNEVIGEPATVIARGRGGAFAVMAAAFSPGNFKKLYLIKPKGMPAVPAKGIVRAFFIGEDADIRYALAKGLLDADYKRVLEKMEIPARVYGGDCGLCDELLAKKRNLVFGKTDVAQVSGGTAEAFDELHKG